MRLWEQKITLKNARNIYAFIKTDCISTNNFSRPNNIYFVYAKNDNLFPHTVN